MSILCGSFHQNDERLNIDLHDKQYTPTAAVACVAFFLLDPNTCTISDIDYIGIVGDRNDR